MGHRYAGEQQQDASDDGSHQSLPYSKNLVSSASRFGVAMCAYIVVLSGAAAE
jgi:hypothetical protein